MPRLLHRSQVVAALIALCAMFMAFMPSSAMAQTIPGGVPASSCGLTNITACIFGDPADLQKNIQKARDEVNKVGCWSCKVFNAFGSVVFKSGEEVSRKGDAALKPVIVAVATLFALFYLGSSFVSGDASELLGRWKVFWRLLIAVAVGTAWLASGSFNTTWDYVYGPLLQIPLAVEQSVSGSRAVPGGGTCSPAARPPEDAPAGAVPAMNEMANVVCGANQVAMEGIAFGIGLSNTGDGIIGSFVNAVAGIILAIVFGWIAITFPLKFIDVLLRLMVVGIVAPVLVVCAVFKPLRSYVQIGIRNVLYAGCLFAFTGIMFKVGYGFIMDIADDVIRADGGQTTGELLGRGIVLIGSGVIFSAMLKMAPSLAAEFSAFSGQSGGVGDAASGFASSVVTLPVKGAGLATGMAATKGAIGKATSGMEKAIASGAASGSERGTAAALAKGVTP